MYQQANGLHQNKPDAKQNMYQYNMDTYLRYNMYPFEPHYGNQNYYQTFEVSFMNQPQQSKQPYMNQQSQHYMTSQYYMQQPSPSANQQANVYRPKQTYSKQNNNK